MKTYQIPIKHLCDDCLKEIKDKDYDFYKRLCKKCSKILGDLPKNSDDYYTSEDIN